MKVIVIGAGLAGAACAYALGSRGCEVTVLSEGGGASALPVGLLAAHLSPQDIALSQLSRIGVSFTLAHANRFLREGVDWQLCKLEQRLLFQPDKNERLRRGAAALPEWYDVQHNSVIHRVAAWIKPQALASAWLAQPGIALRKARLAAVNLSQGLWQAHDAQGQLLAQAPHLILAAGAQSSSLLSQCGHPLTMDEVSGSVAFGVWPDPACETTVINGNGHFIGHVPQEDGNAFWLSGSTYERDIHLSAQEQQAASLLANQERLAKLLPAKLLDAINTQFAAGQVKSWQSKRCTTHDRLPVVGPLEPGLHVCTAMGSRGLSFAALSAEILAQDILPNEAPPLISEKLRRELLPSRKTLKVNLI